MSYSVGGHNMIGSDRTAKFYSFLFLENIFLEAILFVKDCMSQPAPL